jgi:hypothetical protein
MMRDTGNDDACQAGHGLDVKPNAGQINLVYCPRNS